MPDCGKRCHTMRTSRLRRLREEEGQAVVLTYVCLCRAARHVRARAGCRRVVPRAAPAAGERRRRGARRRPGHAGRPRRRRDARQPVPGQERRCGRAQRRPEKRRVGQRQRQRLRDEACPGFLLQGPRHRERHGERRADRHGWGEPERGDGGRTDRRRREAPDAAVQAAPLLQRGDDARPQDDGARSIPAGQRRRLPRRHGPADPAGLGTESRVGPEAPRSTSECARYRSASSRYPGSPLVRWLQWPAR